ncbi:hypothetical protein GCM10025867_23280 [Frondihabitans sucicola]|uniref:ABC transporter permease n=1 Tax=Frondihabitans sucicola TaxID=1268041 RepID=A0ABN6Y1U3_9MICO|nr:hypothetical protein [Frondihabitans sucicola]BDZ50087.1 hypothetical protein GCM10025867_23280 [Frondihabitans sucicola]
MSYRSELRDGWRMFLPYAREVVTRRRLVILLTLAPAVSIVVAAGIDVVVISTDADLDPVLTALAGDSSPGACSPGSCWRCGGRV